jgi:hypothetical protein
MAPSGESRPKEQEEETEGHASMELCEECLLLGYCKDLKRYKEDGNFGGWVCGNVPPF